MPQSATRFHPWRLLLLCWFIAGCSQIGPGTVTRDRFDYNKAVARSWKEQTLLNIVRLRYADMPLFMEVSSIVAGYTLQSSVDVGGEFYDAAGDTALLEMGAKGSFTDRPTITYKPITGVKFNKNFMTPIPPSAVMFLIQSGWPADIVLPLTVESINGLRAQRSVGANKREGDPRFYRVVNIFRQIQRSGAIGVHLFVGRDKAEKLKFILRRSNVSPEIRAAGEELAGLLGVRRGEKEYTIRYGEIPANDTVLALLTRSMMSIMVEMSGQIDVPERHIEEGRTVAPLETSVASVPEDFPRLMTVHHGKEKPKADYVSVRYNEHWFWIDDRDFNSKRIFSHLMTLFSLTETGGKEGLPLITIPAG
jgi:hypothetical protein